MGNTIATTTTPVVYDLHAVIQADLPSFLITTQVSKSKFLKTFLCTHERRSGSTGDASQAPSAKEKCVVKVFLRRGDKSADTSARLASARAQLGALCRVLSLGAQPNLLPYQWFEESTRNDVAFLSRQHVQYSLLERLSSRPFLTHGEKLWTVYQLLRALEQAHAAGVRHGDIKAENCLVTSWGWVFLTDFAAPFKPTFIPDDHPSDFFYFFESSNRKRCYIAPERFVREKELRLGGSSQAQGGGGSSTPAAAVANASGTGGGTPHASVASSKIAFPESPFVGGGAPPVPAWGGGLTEEMDVFAAVRAAWGGGLTEEMDVFAAVRAFFTGCGA
jgi:serine/threonine protein kinase